VMLISQFMGRLARANRGYKTSRFQTDSQTDFREISTQANPVQFNSILLRRSFKKCLTLVYSGPAYLLLSSLSPVRVTTAY
jgi:hypothetical protein